MQENIYLPSSSERKRVITTYLLTGVLFFSGKEELTVYEYFHFKQAIGRYTTTMFFLLAWLLIFRVPLLKYLPFLCILTNLILLIIFISYAWKGQYMTNLVQEKRWKTIYADIGAWILAIFEIKKRVYGDIRMDTPQDEGSQPLSQ